MQTNPLRFARINTQTHKNNILRQLLPHPPQKRLTLPLPPIWLRIRHEPPLPALDLPYTPRAFLPRSLEKVQILLETPAPAFGHVDESPETREEIRASEDGEERIAEVVEEDGREQCDGEVG